MKKTILLDDTFLFIEDSDGEVLFNPKSIYEFNGLVKSILTNSQYEKFIRNETSRSFCVTFKQLENGIFYSKNNQFNTKTQ